MTRSVTSGALNSTESSGQTEASSSNTGSGTRKTGLGSSSSASASLRAIADAARGDKSKGSNPLGAQTPAQTSAQTPAQTSPQTPSSAEVKSSWFSPLAKISSLFQRSKRARDHRVGLVKPSVLDPEGFNKHAQKVQSSKQTEGEKAEKFAFGVLHFNTPQTIWSREALKRVQSFTPKEAQTRAGERALAATHLIHRVDHAPEHAIAIGHAYPKDSAAQELMGHAYLQRGQTSEAQRAFKRAFKLDPKRVSAQQKFSEIAVRNGDQGAATRALDQLVNNGYDAPSVHAALAQSKLIDGEVDSAFGWINNLFSTPPERLSTQDRARALSTLVQVIDRSVEGERNEERLALLQRARQSALQEAVKLNPNDERSVNELLRRHESARNWKSALNEVRALNADSGGSAMLMLREAALLRNLERSDKAQDKLEEALKTYQDDARVHLAAGDVYLESRDYTRARNAFERAQELDPTQPEPILALTQLLIKEARVKEAQAYLEHESAQRPWSAALQSGLGDLKFKLAKTNNQESFYREAAASYDRALSIDPSLMEARAQRARVSLELNQAKTALQDLEWLKRQGYQGDLNFELGQTQQALGQNKLAKGHFSKVLDQDRENLDALRAMGKLMQGERNIPSAKRYYEQALAVNSRDPLTLYELGRLALDEKKPRDAVRRLRIAAESRRQDPKLQYWYGRALEAEGNKRSANYVREAYEGASALLREAKETPTELCDVHYRVGLVHSKRPEELNSALEDFSRASRCVPQRPEVWTRLAESYERLGDRAEVMKNYKRALKQNRNHIPALLGKAKQHLSEIPPQRKQALKTLKRVLRLNRRNAEAYFHMCKLTQSSSRRRAKKHCKRYLKLAPRGKYAEIEREIIRSL